MSKKKIYIIEDDQHIRELLLYKLKSVGFDVESYADGESGLKAILANPPDVILLDLMLPGIDGYELCRQVRADENAQDVIMVMLTARGEEGDKVLGLEIGADDYIVKPFSIREVIARLRAILRRVKTGQTDLKEAIQIGNIQLFPDKHEVYKHGKPIEMKTKEFELLHYLMKNAGRVLSREQLLNNIWGYDYYGETRTVDVHISQLRTKIEDNPDTPKYIKTLRSVGYKFTEEIPDLD